MKNPLASIADKMDKSPKARLITMIALAALVVLLTVAVIILAVNLASRPANEPDPVIPEGAESGLYYFDNNGKEYTLHLHSGNQFTYYDGETKAGTYAVAEDGTITFTFENESDGTANGQVTDGVLTFNYKETQARFFLKVYYNVSFSTDGGSVIDAIPVANGRYVTNPADPTKEDHVFLGWYVDAECKTPFAFASTAITKDTVLYAKWAYKAPGVTEYSISFEGAAVEQMSTIGGKLYGLPTPEKEGYTFGGWWISMGDSADKLTTLYDESISFTENDTLYALWIPENDNAPVVQLSSDQITWNRIDGAIHYTLKIYDPSGSLVYQGNETGTSYKYNFTTPGEYKVELSASVNGAMTAVTERYYVSKALGKVYDFKVIEPSILVFNKVENAEEYIISIVCGTPGHNHSAYNNGNSTVYNFANCDMVEGGIEFTVTAKAEGYAESVSKTFKYERKLDKVTDFSLNNDVITWIPIDKASEYTVVIVSGGQTYTYTTTACSYDLRYFESGEISVSITANAKGYLASEVATYTFEKLSLVTPDKDSIVVSGSVISWAAVSGEGVSYIVYINGEAYPTATNSIDLSTTEGFEAEVGDVLNISVASVVNETTVSSPSENVTVNYGVFAGSLSYNNNTLSWNAVLGLQGQYEVQVGNTASVFVDGTSAPISFNKGGLVTIAVRFVSDDYTSDWIRTSLYVYTITFDVRLGTAIAPIYFYPGDSVTLPVDTTRTGYTFANWYDSVEENGKLITSGKFEYTDNVVLYAHWNPKTYYGIVSGAPEDTTGVANGDKLPAVFDSGYKFPVPSSDAGQFIGWFTGADGTGLQITNDEGVSISNWTFTEDTNVYPKFNGNILTYVERTDGTWAVTSGPDIASVTKVVVPDTYQGKAVTAILENAFKKNPTIKSISIPDTVNLIGVGAFDTAYYFESIEVREVEGNHKRIFSSANGALIKDDLGVKYLELVPRANAGLNGTFTVSSEVTAIRNKAFQYTNRINKVIISDSVTSIAEQAFFHCANLTEIEFMNGGSDPLTIAAGAFFDTELVNTIKLPARLASLSAVDTFDALPKLANIYVEEGGEFYGAIDGILTNGKKDTLIYAPVNFTGVVDIPVGVTTIGDNAFANRAGVTAVIIPNWVTSIGNSAFENATGITSVTIKGGKFEDLTIGTKAFAGCKNNANLVIEGGSSVDSGALIIGDYAFANNAKLSTTNIAANANVTTIGDYAFSGCSKISAVTIQATTTSIGEKAYAQCTDISKVTFAEGVNTTFGAFVFEGCIKLSSISLPASLQSFDGSIFAGCNNIASVEVSEDSLYLAAADGVLYDKDVTTVLYYPKAKEFNLAALPATVTKIGNAAFQGNVGITALTIPARFTEIGNYAFENCVNLASLAFETDTQLTTLGNSAFANCPSLATVTLPGTLEVVGDRAFYLTAISAVLLPDSVTNIGAYAFAKTNITAIIIPKNVTNIAEGAFSDCTKLKTITITAGEAPLAIGSLNDTYGVFEGSCTSSNTTVTLAERVTLIGSRAFYNVQKVTSLKNIETTKLTAIGDYAFFYNKFSNNITLPEGLTSIGAHAFENCIGTNFKTLVIPSTVEEIGESAFKGCTKITSITFNEGAAEATNLSLTLNKGVFEKCTALLSITLPSHLDEAYEDTSTEGGLQITTFPALFNGCTKLQSINVHDDCEKYGDINGIFGEKDENGEITRIIYCPIAYATAELTIPYTITKVDNGAFNGVTAIKSITFENDPNWDETPTLVLGNENYKGYAKGDELYPVIKGTALTSVTLPAHLKTIGCVAFYGWAPTNTAVTLTVDQNAKIKFIGQRAISGTNITAVVLPAVEEISPYCITGNAMMETLSFAAGSAFTEIPSNAFYSNKALKAFEIPASVTVIGPNAFSGTGSVNDNSLASITYAPGCQITTIGDKAFSTLPITSFTFQDSMTHIGTSIFQGCSKLEEITLNSKMTNLYANDGTNIVADATNLREIHVSEDHPYLWSDDYGVLYSKDKTQLLYCSPVNEIAEYVIPEGVTSIEENALASFGAYNAVAKITLPKTLLTIGENAFKNAYIEAIVIPASVQRIEASAFEGVKAGSITFEANADGFTGTSALVYVGAKAFAACTNVTSIDIPDTVTELGEGVFMNCSALTTVDLPASITTLPNNTFSGCKALASIELKEGLENITGDVFSGCSALTSITFPASLKSITTNGSGVFANCSSLESVEFPAGAIVSNVSANVFVNCNKLTSITLPSSVASLSGGMIKGCANIDTITINGNIDIIPDGMFYGFTNLKNINIPTTVTEIGASAFEGCVNLKNINLPAGLTKIGDSAFRGCTALEGVEIGENVAYIGNYAFENCTALASVVFAKDNAIEALGTFTDVESAIFRNTPALTSIELPDSITTIGANLFENSGIKSIKLPASLTAISEYAFSGCKNLETLALPGAVKDICSYAFLDCEKLTSIDVPFGVESFGTAIFMNCVKLASISIPSTIRSIDGNPFINCPALATIDFDNANTDYVYENNMIFDADRFTLVYFSPVIEGAAPILPDTVLTFASGAFYGANITEFVIPSTLTEIADFMFMDLKNLQTIVIPNGITRIGNSAFKGCSALVSVDIPATVTEIGEYAFAGCTSLASANFVERNSAYSIGAHAFDGDTSLANLTIREGLTALTPYMFANTAITDFTLPESVTNVNVEGVFYGCADLATVNMHNNVGITLGDKFFMNCASLNNFTMPTSITRIGELTAESDKGDTNLDGWVSPLEMSRFVTNVDSYAFAGCTSLETLNFTNIYWIGAHAFEGCTSLASATFGKYMTAIGDYAFADCTNLTTLDFSSTKNTWLYGRTEQTADGLTYNQNLEYFMCSTVFGQYAFKDCSSLATVTFAKSTSMYWGTIGAGIFDGCTALTQAGFTYPPTAIKNSAGYKGLPATA